MKLGMFSKDGGTLLSAWQVGSLRILSAGLALLPFALGAFRRVAKEKMGLVMVSGWLGSFIPAVLFCLAELHINSALAGTLNSITPLITLLMGWLMFKAPFEKSRAIGILVGLAGSIMLLASQSGSPGPEAHYGLLVVAATFCYALNVHLVKQKLSSIPSIDIAALAFAGLIPFSLGVLVVSGFFSHPLSSPAFTRAIMASATLGVVGTAMATIIFYKLVKQAGPVFASLVTYGIPFVAIGWGVIFGENISPFQWVSLAFILAGVYLSNRNI